MSAVSFGNGRVCGFMRVYMSVSCSCDQLSMCRFLWSSECVYLSKCGWVLVTKRQEVGVFKGDVPLPKVFPFLSFMLMASDAPSGICEEREEERRGGGGQRAQGQRWARVHQNSIIKHALKGSVVLRGVNECVLRASRVVLVCWSLAGLIKVNSRWNGLNSLASEPRLLVQAAAHCSHSSVPTAQHKPNRALNKYR